MNNENLSTTPSINPPSSVPEDYGRTGGAFKQRPADGKPNEIPGGSTPPSALGGHSLLAYSYANLESVAGPPLMGGVREYGGTLKGSKGGGSAMQSPHKSARPHLCDCFRAGDSGRGRKNRHSGRARTNMWPSVLANMGICALLLGYIVLGSFIFLAIENSGPTVDIPAGASSDTAAIWHISQMPKKMPQPHEASLTNHRGHSSSSLEELSYARLANDSALRMARHQPKQMPLHNYAHGDYVSDMGDDDEVLRDDTPARHEEDLERQRTVENIWDITVSLNILYKENWTKLASMEIAKFQNQLVKRLVTDLTQAGDPNSHGLHSVHQRNYQSAQNLWLLREQRHRQREQQHEQFKWTFATAFLYSLTVITTVGYGTITPRTTLGRMATIGYATFGIPLTLIYLSTIGGTLARLAQPLCTRLLCCGRNTQCGRSRAGVRKQQVADKKCNLPMKQLHHAEAQPPYCYVRPPPLAGEISSVSGGLDGGPTGSASFDTLSIATTTTTTTGSHNTSSTASLVMPVAICALLLGVYVGFGSLVIALLERWSLLDGVYFCFMSLTTIGFCDLLPGLGRGGVAVWFCAAYILAGLTLTSMCVNLLHEEILRRMRVVVTVQTRAPREKERGFYSARP